MRTQGDLTNPLQLLPRQPVRRSPERSIDERTLRPRAYRPRIPTLRSLGHQTSPGEEGP